MKQPFHWLTPGPEEKPELREYMIPVEWLAPENQSARAKNHASDCVTHNIPALSAYDCRIVHADGHVEKVSQQIYLQTALQELMSYRLYAPTGDSSYDAGAKACADTVRAYAQSVLDALPTDRAPAKGE